MLVAVVLGNRLNDDGSGTNFMRARLQLAISVYEKFAPQRIILSGGLANPKAGKTEAQYMYDYLVQRGIPSDVLVKEDKSLTTKQNAQFSVPMAVELGATEIVLITSTEHMSRIFLNPVALFQKYLRAYPNVQLHGYWGN